MLSGGGPGLVGLLPTAVNVHIAFGKTLPLSGPLTAALVVFQTEEWKAFGGCLE